MFARCPVLLFLCFSSFLVNNLHGFDFGFGPALTRLDMSFQAVPAKEFSDVDGFYKIRTFDLKTGLPLVRKQSFDNNKISILRVTAQAGFERSVADITFLPRQHVL